jgi:hypothetical protein
MKSKKSSSGVQECEERARLREIKVKRQEKNKLYEITKIHVFYSFHVTQTGVTLHGGSGGISIRLTLSM